MSNLKQANLNNTDLTNAKNIAYKPIIVHKGYVISVAISSDYKFIVSGSSDQTIRVCERKSGTQLQGLKGHNGEVWSVAITLDNKYIVSGSEDQTIRVWEIESGMQL